MKEQFISKRFNIKSRNLLSKIVAIVEQYAADGYDLSLRRVSGLSQSQQLSNDLF